MLIVKRLEHYIVDGDCDARKVGNEKVLLWNKLNAIWMKYILHVKQKSHFCR